MLQRQRLLRLIPHIPLRGMFVAVDRTHAVRSVTHSHDASGARTHRFGGSLPSRPVAVLIRAAWPCQDSPLMGARDRCTGWEDKATVTGRISALSIALSGGSNRSKLHFPINRNRAGLGGGMRAGTRRPSPCRVSIGWAKEDQGILTEQEQSSGPGGKKASRIRDRIGGPVA